MGEQSTEQVKQQSVQFFFFTHPLLKNSSPNFMLFTYLKPYFQVFTELGAATQFAVQALVNEAVELIRAVATVVFMVAEQRLVHAVSIIADVRGVVALLLCSAK